MKCCATCKYWYGDKKRAVDEYNNSDGKAFDLYDGWSISGRCSENHVCESLETITDAFVNFTPVASFHCAYYEWDGERVFLDGLERVFLDGLEKEFADGVIISKEVV